MSEWRAIELEQPARVGYLRWMNTALLVMGVFDWWSTRILAATGLGQEANPIMRLLLGTWGFDVVKLGIHVGMFLIVMLVIEHWKLQDDRVTLRATGWAFLPTLVLYSWVVVRHTGYLLWVWRAQGGFPIL